MKSKISLPVLAVTGAMAVGLLLTGCDWFKGKDGSGLAYEWCTVDYEDSIAVGAATAHQEMHIDFPANQDIDKADKGTVTALAWIREQVMACSFPNYEGEKLDTAVEFGIDQVERFAEPFVKSCGRQGLDRMGASLRTFSDEIGDGGYDGSFINFLQIELLEQTPEYLTLSQEHDVYTGGAHGGQYLCGVTFSKDAGTQLGWNIFNLEKKGELVALIKAELKKAFSDGAEEPIVTDEQLNDLLILWDNPETPEDELEFGLPLPVTDPWLTRDGIVFLYQEYEIACYAMGRPSVILPYEVLLPLLTDEAKALLKR